MYAIIKGAVLVALKDDYQSARLVQFSTGNPLEFFVIEVSDLVELQNVMVNNSKIEELNLDH